MLLCFLPLLPILLFTSTLQIEKSYFRLAISGGITALYFMLVTCWILKDPFVLGLLQEVTGRLKKH